MTASRRQWLVLWFSEKSGRETSNTAHSQGEGDTNVRPRPQESQRVYSVIIVYSCFCPPFPYFLVGWGEGVGGMIFILSMCLYTACTVLCMGILTCGKMIDRSQFSCDVWQIETVPSCLQQHLWYWGIHLMLHLETTLVKAIMCCRGKQTGDEK